MIDCNWHNCTSCNRKYDCDLWLPPNPRAREIASEIYKLQKEVREIEFWLYVDVYNDKNSFDLENELSKLKVKIEDLNLEEKNIRTLRRIEGRGVING